MSFGPLLWISQAHSYLIYGQLLVDGITTFLAG